MNFIGIDPGKKGGLSIITDQGTCLDAQEMFVTADGSIDSNEIYNWLQIYKFTDKETFCILEKSQSMPGQSSVATFTYGVSYGEIRTVLKILQIPFQEIHPMKWKKEFSLIKKDKSDSVDCAEKLFPTQVFKTERGRLMDGKAESLLLAEYGRRIYNK